MDTFLNCNLSKFRNDLPNVAIRNSIRTDSISGIFPITGFLCAGYLIWNKQRLKVAHIIYMQPVYILDLSTERSSRELCWTGGNNIQYFHYFDKENYVLYELKNIEWIKCFMHNILLNEKKNYLTFIVYWLICKNMN